ncbi:hypothetical protein AB4851_12145 [Burkholderia sp. 22PA0099]|uniref:hypothetical protein n=1 Tax=Burkholderia sp. 22PA0099 TaxID=3237372 RepID=UPI0039C1481C
MQQSSRLSSVAELIADSSLCLPGFKLTHRFHIVSLAHGDAAARVSAYLAEQGARADSAPALRCRELLTQTLVLDGIGERRARALREQLLAIDGVQRIRLEHCFVRDDAPADDAADLGRPVSVTAA